MGVSTSARDAISDSRANLLVDRLLEVLRVDDGADLAGRIRGPVRSDDLDFRLARVDPASAHSYSILIRNDFTVCTHLPEDGSVEGFGPTLGRPPVVRLVGFSFRLDWRFPLQRSKYESPELAASPGAGTSGGSLNGDVMSGTPGGWAAAFTSRFRFDVLLYGGPLVIVWKSPYIRLISALFSSMNSSMRSLFEKDQNKPLAMLGIPLDLNELETSDRLRWRGKYL